MKRECGSCTACCTVMAVTAIDKPAYKTCPSVCDKGCSIYEKRPEACASYSCLWLIDDKILRDEDQPNRTGLIFEMSGIHRKESNFEAQTGIAFLVARETKPGAFEGYYAQKTLKRLSKKILIIRAYEDGRRVGMGPPEKVRALGGFLDSLRGS